MQQREKYPISKGPSESFLIFDEALGIQSNAASYSTKSAAYML